MFNRLKYDKCATQTENLDNVSIFDHYMDVARFVNDAPCRHERGIVGGNSASTVAAKVNSRNVNDVWGTQITVENDLRGQTRSQTRCPAYDFIPEKGRSTSREIYKPVVHPVIRTEPLNHLDGCQMLGNYPSPSPV